MARISVSSRKIDEIRAANQGLKQQEADAKTRAVAANSDVGLAGMKQPSSMDMMNGLQGMIGNLPPTTGNPGDFGIPAGSTSINSGGAPPPTGLPPHIKKDGNSYTQTAIPNYNSLDNQVERKLDKIDQGNLSSVGGVSSGSGVTYGPLGDTFDAWSTPSLPAFGGQDARTNAIDFSTMGYADGGPISGPPGYDQVPAEMPDGSPARLSDGEFVLPKDYVIGYAAKALGKKGATLPADKLHALGIDLLTQDVAQLTGKQPGAQAMPPLPGQKGPVPGMADGGGLGWDAGTKLSFDAPQWKLEQQAARHADAVVSKYRNMGAARQAAAPTPDYMQRVPVTNRMPIPYQGRFSIPRPPLPMADPMPTPLTPYTGTPATTGSASYWRGWNAPPSNQMPALYQAQEGALVRYTPGGGAMAPYGSPMPGSASAYAGTPSNTIHVNRYGTAERGPLDPRPLIDPQEVRANQARAASATRGSPIVSQAQQQARAAAQARASLGGRIGAMAEQAGSAAKTAGSFAGRVAGGIGRGLAAMDPVAWGGIVPRDMSEVRSLLGLAPDFGPNNGPGVDFEGDVPVVPTGKTLADLTGDPNDTPSAMAARANSQMQRYGLDPSIWQEGAVGQNTADWGQRTRNTIDEHQRALAKAYYQSTGIQRPESVHPDDTAYMVGLREAFNNRKPGQNLASAINRRTEQPPVQALPDQTRQTDYILAADQLARQIAQRARLSPEHYPAVFAQVLDRMTPHKPDAAMARLYYDMQQDPIKQQQHLADQQFEMQKALNSAYVALLPQMQRVVNKKTFDPQYGTLTGETPYLMNLMAPGENGQPAITPLFDGQGPNIVDPFRGGK